MSFCTMSMEQLDDDILRFFKNSNDIDTCITCENKSRLLSCDKCGEGVCSRKGCSLAFPHYYNSLFVLCGECIDEISNKFKLVIDKSQLRLLKQKIENKQCRICST